MAGRPPSPEGSSQPLLERDPALNDEAQAVRTTVVHSRLMEGRDARNSLLLVSIHTFVNVPQIVAAAVILALKWTESTLCYRIQIWWAIYWLSCGRTSRIIALRERYLRHISNLKFGLALSLAGFFWFLVGNMWVISYGARCDDGSTLYQLAFWMIVITYTKFFLPCIVPLVLLPVICFCVSCVNCLFDLLEDLLRGEGATQEAISRLETKKFAPAMFAPNDSSCSICLNEFELSQELRVLPCVHHFHIECVDEWLLVNATCPTCRKPIDDGASAPETRSEDDVLGMV
ncbi:hypothetical protein PINS_up018848 [Pythium insidiosum]|nr:hypothetical protein PINS_up018848 [Pythium insidiosum]